MEHNRKIEHFHEVAQRNAPDKPVNPLPYRNVVVDAVLSEPLSSRIPVNREKCRDFSRVCLKTVGP
jgi:hypothetical protein